MKHNLLKSVILSVILLMGVSNAWGNDFQGQGEKAGWISNEGLILTWDKNGTTATTKMNYSSISSGGALGNINSKLILTKTEAKFWREDAYGNICSATVFWELYKGNSLINNGLIDGDTWGEWNGNDCSLSKTTSVDFYDKTTGPGEYTIKIYGKLTGRSQAYEYDNPNYLGCEDNFWYNNNNSGSYSITFVVNPVVTFKANGGTGSDKIQRVTYNTNTTLDANTFTRTGYRFTGWKTEASSGTSYSDKATVKLTANLTLYAQWEIREDKIVLWADNGSFGKNASGGKITEYDLYIQYGTNTFYTKDDQGNKTYVTAPMPSSSIRKYCRGFYFGGDTAKLVIDKYGKLCKGVVNGNRYTDDNGNWVYTGTSNQTSVKAWYSDKYPVELDANSGIWTSTGRKVTYVEYDKEELVPDITGGSSSLPWKTGYTFDGYYVNADGTGDKYYDKDGKGLKPWTFFSTDTDIIEKLYANYTLAVYNITYDNLGDATHTNPATYTIETPTISFAAPTKDRTGYTFKNWSPSSIAKGSTNNKTITAQWTANTYTVSFDQQSGTGGTTSVTATYDAAMPTISTPTRTGYTFGGYYSEKNGGGTQYYKADGKSANIWNKIVATTLYAKWNANSYTVQFNANGGIGSMANQAFTYDAAQNLTQNSFTRTGYTFAGWNTKADGTGTSYTNSQSVRNLTAVNNGTVTLYAKWTANTYTVTLDPQGGSNGSTSTSAKSGVAMSAITPPTRDGYIFEGYYSEPNGQGKKYYNADGSSANLWDKENATLYAKWVSYDNCIFFKNNVNWDNVYVYTFTDNAWYNDVVQGEGGHQQGVNPKVNKLEHGKMAKLNNESDIYYYILEGEQEIKYIAFSEKDMHEYTTFYDSEAVYRGDYTNKMSLFIPYYTTKEEDLQKVNNTTYYKKGVWMKYNSKESGYRLNLMGEGGVYFITNEPGGYVFTATVHLSTKNPYKLDITTLQSEKKFSNENYMTSANCTGWTMDEWNWATESTWGINPTLVGEYTFTMNLAEGKVSVSATYPTLTETVGDYRLLYVEQVVEKSNASGNEWKTIITRKKAHPSDIIKQSELASEGKIVSLHIYKDRKYSANAGGGNVYESFSNPEIILQQCTAVVNNKSQWKDIERHMVYGPLETLPGMAMAPGRRNTAAETPVLVYDDGIEAIKTADNNGNGVWNFTVKASGSTATIDLTKTERYPLTTGNYYIRTANAEGAWHNYKIDANRMTYSKYATNNNEFTHYFCKWINTDVDGSKNVQFVIANDYGQAISDTIVADRATLLGVALAEGERMVGDDGLLPTKANVRFSWKEDNNALHRAYLNGSGEADADYLVVRDASNGNGHGLYTFDNNGKSKLTDNKKTFSDNGGWMYHADVRAETLAPVTITATYNGKKQYFKGSDSETQPIIKGNANDTRKHPIRILYDFKENRYFTAYVPIEAVTEDVAIETDVMIIRRNHEEANQLQLTPSPRVINEGKTAYGAITFTEDFLSSNSWTVTNDKKFYWISFPFDVKLSEAFGFGKYAVHWYIEYYDGKSRAENGLFYESGTYWKYVTKSMAANYVLEANKGYLLWLNVPRVQSDNFFAGDITEISIYFPSKEPIDPSYESYSNVECTLEPLWRPEGSRRYYDDSNWHLIGVPSYANTTESTQQNNAKFVYDYIAATDTYEPKSSAQIGNFKSMFAYMVQYTGNINWSTIINDHNPAQKAIIAQQKSSDNNEHLLRLELQQNDSKSDQTFIQLQEQDVTTKFDMNHDLCKIINAGANIYTIITEEQEPIQVAANLLPDSESIIPVGIKLDAAGEYTFAMPDGTDGIVVELIDYETNTRTNMLLDNYTVNLGKGTFENRFALHVKPNKTTTSVDNIGNEATGDKVKKYLIDGILYMQKDGVLYDAQGKLVR